MGEHGKGRWQLPAKADWTISDGKKPSVAQLMGHWSAIERHPRLVFASVGPAEAEMIRYYLERGRPFTVVVGA